AGETLDLPPVGMRVLAQRPAKMPVAHREAFDQGRLVKPGKKDLAPDAAVLAVGVKAFLEVAADGDGQIEMAQAAVGIVHADEPAVGAKPLQQAGVHGTNLAAQETGAIDQVA